MKPSPRILATGLCLLVARVSRAESVEVIRHETDRRVDVRIGGQAFTSYLWPESLTKPALYPLLTAAGAPITRGFPLHPRPGERTDHPHHVGLWLSFGDVNGVDFWNNSTAQPAEAQARMGRTRHLRVAETTSGKDEGRLRVASEWILPDGFVALDEDTTFVFRGAPGFRALDRTSRLTARARPVLFADNKEGFLGLRVARSLEQPSKEAVTLTDSAGRPTTVAALDNEGVTGLYHSSEGQQGDAVWGTRGRWVALSGRVGGEDVTVVMLDHPDNPGTPTYWHARGYGLFAANNLGPRALSNGRESLDLRLAPGAFAVFRWRIAILSRAFDAALIEAAWKEWSAVP